MPSIVSSCGMRSSVSLLDDVREGSSSWHPGCQDRSPEADRDGFSVTQRPNAIFDMPLIREIEIACEEEKI